MITLNNWDTGSTFRASLNTNFGNTLDKNNNLSDLANTVTARTNLWLGKLAIADYQIPMQWALINGRINVSVASNNITVSILTLSGATPSSSEPVYVRIGNSMRSITSSLFVTKNAWTNWFNSWSAELATYEIDYFVYLGYNATDGVVIWFARIPYARQYSDFSATTTNEKYCAISTITNATSTDYYENIGRFGATLSAWASYNWSVPTFTALNLINRPIFETRLLTYAPTIAWYSANPTATYFRYKVTGTTCYVKIREWTAGTSNSTSTTYTTPFSEPNTARWCYPIQLVDNWTTPATPWMAQLSTNTNVITMHKDYNSWLWTNSWNKRIIDSNIYFELI